GTTAVEVERFFAEHRPAGARRSFDKTGLCISRAGDHHGMDGSVRERLDLAGDHGAIAGRTPLRGSVIRISDDLQPRIRMAEDVSCMDRADAARAELAEIDHS